MSAKGALKTIKWDRTHLLVLGDNVLEERVVDDNVVSSLLERDTVNLPGLDERGDVGGVHLWQRGKESVSDMQS